MSMVSPPAPSGVDTLLARSWTLFKRGWIVALPPFIGTTIIIAAMVVYVAALIAAGIADAIARHGDTLPTTLLTTIGVGYVVVLVGAVVVSLWAYAAMFGMADALWEHGTTSFGDGFAAFRTRGAALFVAGIGFFGLAIVALVLALPTLCLALFAYPLLTMYTVPAVVSGGRGGFEAFGESFRLVRAYFVPSIIAMLVLYGIWYGVSLVGSVAIVPLEMSVMPEGSSDAGLRMPPIPLMIGSAFAYVITLVASIAYAGFIAVALTGLYRELTGRLASPQPAPRIELPG